MQIHKNLKQRLALNKAFLKDEPVRTQIDKMVYELYVLTEKEIKLVKGGDG
jgi:hypothetical protein